jgi:ferredoxin
MGDEMDVEIRVDRVRCMGSGQCVHWAPGVFEQDDEAISVVVDPRGEPEEKIVQAVTACPVQAITLAVGGVRVGPDDLQDWVQGAARDDAIVGVLEQLSVDHHELRALLGAARDDATPTVEELCASTRAHLRAEDDVYDEIVELVGAELVDAFQDDHDRIERALDALAARAADEPDRGPAVEELASVVDDHIRLEETVLFPVALAALATRPTPRSSRPVTAG